MNGDDDEQTNDEKPEEVEAPDLTTVFEGYSRQEQSKTSED